MMEEEVKNWSKRCSIYQEKKKKKDVKKSRVELLEGSFTNETNMRRTDLTNKIQVLRQDDLLLVSVQRIQRKTSSTFLQCAPLFIDCDTFFIAAHLSWSAKWSSIYVIKFGSSFGAHWKITNFLFCALFLLI